MSVPLGRFFLEKNLTVGKPSISKLGKSFFVASICPTIKLFLNLFESSANF